MVSMWESQFVTASLQEEFEESFKTEDSSPVVSFSKELLDKFSKSVSFDDSLTCLFSGWEFVSSNEQRGGVNLDQVFLMVECLARASRQIILSGDWMGLDKALKDKLECLLRKCLEVGVGKKDTVEGLLALVLHPWDSPRIKNLLTGKSELQQEVLSLVSGEGVDTVLLRTELLLEAGLDKPAYKFVSNVVSSLLADHIVFESYVLTSRPGTLESLVDIFIALTTATHHLAKLYKVLRLLGLEEVNNVYLPRFKSYSSSPKPGRCSRLFTTLVCSKVLQIIYKWSMAGASVKESPSELQSSIIERWLVSQSGDNLQSLLPDINTLVSSASQTSFLYNLAIVLWRKFGLAVETVSLKMFIKGLTSDINQCEVNRKNKSKRLEIEARLANGFWLLSEILAEKVSLAREAVLTGFSIAPNKQMLEKIRELAKISGLDKLSEDNTGADSDENDEQDHSLGIHCRVTAAGRFSRAKALYSSESEEVGSTANVFKSIQSNLNVEEMFKNLNEKMSNNSFGRAQTKLRTHKRKNKKKFRNLDGLLAIQGELITEASNYDPLDKPCKSLTPSALGLPQDITDDLLIVISAPRWHILSWVMDWTDLERNCVKLLENPNIRVPSEELKYLNIDYTQFDEWSSDEEVTIYTGIEKGYEAWLEVGDGDGDKFSEHGLTSDDEEVVFNTKHTIDRLDYNDQDHFITNIDYNKNDDETDECQKNSSKDKAMDIEDEITDEPRDSATVEPEPEKPGSAMEIGCALVASPCTSLSASMLRGRLAIARQVPGLEGTAVPGDLRVSHQVMMVQISGVVVGEANAVNTSPGTVVLRPGTSVETRPSLSSLSSLSRPGQTTIRLSPVTSPSPRPAAPPATPGPPGKKVQYICKQGGQTFLIESSAVLEKLRAAGGGSVQIRLPVSAVTKSDMSEGLAGRLGTLLTNTSTSSNSPTTNTNTAKQGSTIVVTRPPTTAVSETEPTTPTTPTKTENSSPADLIRQLNLARAQGLVILQQWGDKQVLVHKATGRWIMRQGSRLVTVPPQALGINVTEGTAGGSNPDISSRTMEQLAEFDSILESKFKMENGEMRNGGVVVVSGSGNTKQVIQLPTTPLKKELVLGGIDGIKSNQTSPIKSPPVLPNPSATYPKPQEDPETMKRIQAILDDYNDQMRNSPDLHNRPAPRRRTNGSGNPDSPKPDSPRSSGTASGSTSPSNLAVRRCGSESLSPSPSMSPVKSDPLTVAMAEIKESGTLTLAAKPNSIPCQTQTNSNVRLVPKVGGMGQLGQRIVVPAGTVQRLVVVSSAEGRRMLAVRPVAASPTTFTNTISTNNLTLSSGVPVTVSLPTSPVSLSSLGSLISRPSTPPRPPTPDLGIPMEMTPGQIMEAEISATLLDNPGSPFPSGSLPDTVFSVSSPGPGLDSDFDQVIQTSQPSSHLSPDLVSSQLELTSDSQRLDLNTRGSRKRRRSERNEEFTQETKVIRLETS